MSNTQQLKALYETLLDSARALPSASTSDIALSKANFEQSLMLLERQLAKGAKDRLD